MSQAVHLIFNFAVSSYNFSHFTKILVRDYEDSVREMKKENFNLKLKIFFLEERLAVGNENKNVGLLADNIDLKVNKTEYLNSERERAI